MGTLKKSGRVETVTDATPEQVWAVVCDVTRVGEWSHECKGAVWVDGATTAKPGARFAGSNRIGRIKWGRVNEIVTVEAPHELAWRTVATRLYPDSTAWRIRIEPDGARTRIVQTFGVLKLNPLMDRLVYLVTPAHRDRLPALADDIRRLGEVAAGRPGVPAT